MACDASEFMHLLGRLLTYGHLAIQSCIQGPPSVPPLLTCVLCTCLHYCHSVHWKVTAWTGHWIKKLALSSDSLGSPADIRRRRPSDICSGLCRPATAAGFSLWRWLFFFFLTFDKSTRFFTLRADRDMILFTQHIPWQLKYYTAHRGYFLNCLINE